MAEGSDYQIIKVLDEWEAREGSLPEPLQLFRQLLTVQAEIGARVETSGLCLTREVVSERSLQGHPALEFGDLPIDWALFAEALKKVVSVFGGYANVLGEMPAALTTSLSGELLGAAAKAWYEGNQLPLAHDAENSISEVVLSAVFKPFLSLYSEALLPLVNQELWRRSYCPICGGAPDFSFLDKERGARWLLCSRCDARWLFQRMGCHSCGNQNQNELSYYTDDKGLYRLYVCERCKCYLKAIDLRQTEKEVCLPLERFITLDLDRQAQQKGYHAYCGAEKVELASNGG